MGADLCLEYVTIKKSKKPDWKKGLAKIKALEKVWVEEAGDGELDESVFGYPIAVEDAVDELKSDLANLKEAVKNRLRDVTCISVGNYLVYATGGMTWGDDPSDSYSSFTRLNATGVAKACGFDF